MKVELTLIIAFIGWVYLYLLNNRGLKRAEIGRLKDDIINLTLKESSWLVEHLNKKNRFSATEDTELLWAIKTTQIELKIVLINDLSKFTLLNINKVAALRDIDFKKITNNEVTITDLSADLIEEIESNYHYFFFNLNIFSQLYKKHSHTKFSFRERMKNCLFGISALITGIVIVAILYHFATFYLQIPSLQSLIAIK